MDNLHYLLNSHNSDSASQEKLITSEGFVMMVVVLKKCNIIKDEFISLVMNSSFKAWAYVQHKLFLSLGFIRLLDGPICVIIPSPKS